MANWAGVGAVVRKVLRVEENCIDRTGVPTEFLRDSPCSLFVYAAKSGRVKRVGVVSRFRQVTCTG